MRILLTILLLLIAYFIFKGMLIFCHYGIAVVGMAMFFTVLSMVSLLLIAFGVSLIIMGVNLMTGGR